MTSGGYFVVRNPVTGERLALRQGQFQMDGDHLVALGSLRVQGFTDSTFTAIGDIVINATGGPTGADTATGTRPRLTSYSIAKDGSIYVTLPDGTAFVRGQVLVQRFREAFLLKELAPGVFGNLDAASPLGDPTGPGTQGTGQIQNGALELLPQRENLLPPSRSALRLRITGEPGRNWIIQATSDFKNWERVGLITSAAGEMEFAEPFQQSTLQRFFRVLVTGP